MRTLDRKLVRDLGCMKGQALAIGLVTAAGVAMYVMSLGALAALDETRAAYYERNRFADVFAHAKRAPERVAAEIARLPGVARASSRIVADVTIELAGVAEPLTGRLISLDPDPNTSVNAVYLRRGRMPSAGHADEALLLESFADARGLGPGDHLDAIINERKRTIEIVGIALSPEYVYAIAPGTIIPDNNRFAVLWMNRPVLAAAFDLDGAFDSLSLTLEPGAETAPVLAAVDARLAAYGGTGAYGRRDQVSDAYLSTEIEGLRATASIMPPIFLGVAAFLINIVMSRLVETQRGQIGLMKAFGYSSATVAGHYLKLAGLVIGAGAVLGFGIGAWLGRGLTQIYAQFYSFPFLIFRPSAGVYAGAAAASLVAAGIGALAAIRHATRLPPAEAMHPPAPPAYRDGPLMRLVQWKGFSQPVRMILRNILRTKLRAGMTILGLALALGLLIGVSFMADAVERLIEHQFFITDREQASVYFDEPRDAATVTAVRRLPGVLFAESFRRVPARIASGARARRTGIVGLAPVPQLARPVDGADLPMTVPADGILLSSKLAELLGVRAGAVVSVSILEGTRPVRDLIVRGVFESYVGISAMMARQALNRMMDEPPSITGAHLLLDPEGEGRFYAAVKATPGISGVSLHRATLAMFRSTMAQSLLTMVFFNIAFAAVIAVGIVYNSARITFSERARELATLRVLGFSRPEVSFILLGEVAWLTVLALPLGAALGYGLAATMAALFNTDMMRIPLVIAPRTYVLSIAVIVLSTVLSGLAVRRRIDTLDLVSVLKTRE